MWNTFTSETLSLNTGERTDCISLLLVGSFQKRTQVEREIKRGLATVGESKSPTGQLCSVGEQSSGELSANLTMSTARLSHDSSQSCAGSPGPACRYTL